MKKFVLILLLLPKLILSLEAREKSPYVLSIPKAGGHMVLKMMTLFPDPPQCQWSDHVIAYGMRNPLYYDSEVMKLIMVRDLRDVFVSLVYWFDAQLEAGLLKRHMAAKRKRIDDLIEQWNGYSMDEKLRIVLEDGKENLYYSGFMTENIEEACRLLKLENNFVFHFEELVGPRGGGDQIAQWDGIRRFAQFFSIELSDIEIQEIGIQMFGTDYESVHDRTFRKGQIGSWKEHYSSENLALFESKYALFQKELGY